jgi:hypothetical protein
MNEGWLTQDSRANTSAMLTQRLGSFPAAVVRMLAHVGTSRKVVAVTSRSGSRVSNPAIRAPATHQALSDCSTRL